MIPYWIVQVLGGIAARGFWCLSPAETHRPARRGLAANGFAEHSPGNYSMAAGFVCEVVMTAVFLFVIMGATDRKAPVGFGAGHWPHPHLDPSDQHSRHQHVGESARSTGPAVFVQGWALSQLWLFWAAPLMAARSRCGVPICHAGLDPGPRRSRRPRYLGTAARFEDS